MLEVSSINACDEHCSASNKQHNLVTLIKCLDLAIMFKIVHQLFAILLLLCVVVSAQPNQPYFELVREAVKRQEVYFNLWKELANKAEIIETEIEYRDRKYPLFKFEGENVKQMKVKEIFLMLQNWVRIMPNDQRHRFIEMDLGGEPFRFRFQKFHGQILVYTEHRGLTKYNDISNVLDNSEVSNKVLAREMLRSSNEPLNAQTSWTAASDANVKEKMRMLMIISQVAEAARPSDESYTKLMEIMAETLKFEISSENTIWERDINNELKELKTQLPEDTFNNLRASLLHENNIMLQQAARNVIEGRASENNFFNLLPEEPSLTPDIKNSILEVAKAVVKKANENAEGKFNAKISGYSPKNGRIPGADGTIRSILQSIAEGDIATFNEAFNEHFIQSKKGGTQLARKSLFHAVDSGPVRREAPDDVPVPKTKRQRVNAEDVAASDGIFSNLEDSIKDELSRSCESRRRRKRQTSCSHKRLKFVEESFSWTGDRLTFDSIDEEGRKRSHEVAVDLDAIPLTEYTNEYIANLEESGFLVSSDSELVDTAGKTVAIYGAIVNTLASIRYFSQDDYGKGVFSAAQAVHGVGGLTGFNDVVSEVTNRAVRRSVTITAERLGLEQTFERITETGIKALGETTSRVLSRFASSVPYVGLAFDAYFIAEDIKELTDENSPLPLPLKIIHLYLDVDIAALTLLESAFPPASPIVAPVIITFTITRIAIDDFYLDIQEELSKVSGKDFRTKLFAFLNGVENGIFDVETLGLGRQLRQFTERRLQDRLLLHHLSNPVNYFNITFQGRDENGEEVGTVDFTAGMFSQFGGFLTLKLNENGSFTVELPQVPDENGVQTQIEETFSFNNPVYDVVLGIGKASHPEYIKQEAKLWLVITVQSFDIIERFETHKSSQYGTYYGNSHDNNFYAVQDSSQRKKRSSSKKQAQKRSKRQIDNNCPSANNFTLQLQSYHYDLYGGGGNDRFFLGPQSSRVTGGDNNDFYHIPTSGGKAFINNFAHDEEMDTLYLDVSYSDIFCARNKQDLVIGYCQSHTVHVQNWFSQGIEEFHRHIYISTADGVVVEVTKSELDQSNHRTLCAPVTIDKSKSSMGQSVTLTGDFSNVKQVIGSNHSDTIIGNSKANTLNGVLGDDYLQGGNGPDMYIVQQGSGFQTINNYATDNQEDLLYISLPYTTIAVERVDSNLILYHSLDHNDTQIQVSSWFNGQDWQHMTFASSDHVTFTVQDDDTSTAIARKHPLTIDLSESQNGVILDLLHPEECENITDNSEIADEVTTILDSPYNDNIIGNMIGNILSCSGGYDFLQGNGGRDTYVIDDTCNSVSIQNYDQAEDYDLILLKCSNRNINLLQSTDHDDLLIQCTLRQNQVLRIHLKRWFVSSQYQHLMIKTSDKIAAFLPETATELSVNRGHLLPFQVEKDEDCEGEHRMIDLSQAQLSKCERIVAKTDACSYSVVGNSLNNYIDPGPGNPYGHQTLKGANGSDTYVIGHRYGLLNVIDNYADDGQVDHLLLEVLFHDIEASLSGLDIFLKSLSSNDSVQVIISNYFEGESYQHLVVHSADGILFKFTRNFPHIEVLMIDFSESVFSEVITADSNSTFAGVRRIIGSKIAENYIQGGDYTRTLIGGNLNDTIIGGPGGEDFIGHDGDDIIDGGPGDDVLFGGEGNDFLSGGPDDDIFYPGMGADSVDGGSGSNTVVFSGRNYTGVVVNLQVGLGWKADAEGDSYDFISNIFGSEYDDVLVGNDDDNTIKGQGGNDFIVPAGGDDILIGGRGTDIYYLNDAVGHKVINNFATDNATDLIVVNNSLWENMCYHYIGDDLQINFNFDIRNSTEAFTRLMLNEVFFMVTLPFWLENATYQHVVFSFLDRFATFNDFEETNHQLESMIDTIRNETLLLFNHVRENEIYLTIDFILFDFTTEQVSLELVHLQPNLVAYHPLSFQPETVTQNIRLENLTAGTQHSFSLMLNSCGLTVVMSPLVSVTTLPSPPMNPIVRERYSDGFLVEWTLPDNNTNPYVYNYQYIIIVSNRVKEEHFEFIITDTGISILDLLPRTEYNVSICSEVMNKISCSPVFVTSTTENTCSNLQSLPSHFIIGEFQRNIQGQVVAHLGCETGYLLVGGHQVVCNDTGSLLSRCAITTCNVPSTPHADAVVEVTSPMHAERVEWECNRGYWISHGVTRFGSTCFNGSWNPPVLACTEKPRCTAPTPPHHGSIHPTDIVLYLNDTVRYSCNFGYRLQGSTTKRCQMNENNGITFWFPTTGVTCNAIQCSVPTVSHADIHTGSNNGIVSHGDTVEWTCHSDYWFTPGTTDFNSTCTAGSWHPSVQQCTEKPRCPAPVVPQYGSVSPASSVYHLDDVVSYSCNSGYSLVTDGVTEKTCVQGYSTLYWSPSSRVSCDAMQCPRLLPQTNGYYSPVQYAYYTGDTVELVCNTGYYVRNDRTQPERTQLHCLGSDWNQTQQHCRPIIQVELSALYIDRAEGTVQYAVSSLRTSEVPAHLYTFACTLMIGTHARHEYITATSLRCYTQLSLTGGPNIYEGILSISTQNGNEKVCIEEISAANLACSSLGYRQYTASVYNSALAIGTTLSSSSSMVENVTKSCYKRISCRKSCQTLYLDNGYPNPCSHTLEGQSCCFSCNAGYGLLGSSCRTCGSNGRWSGHQTRCDGKYHDCVTS